MDVLHRSGFRECEVLVAAVQVFPPEIIGCQVLPLKMRTGRTVKNDDLLSKEIKK